MAHNVVEVWRIQTLPTHSGRSDVLLYAYAPSLGIAVRYESLHAERASSAKELGCLSSAAPHERELVKTVPLTAALKELLRTLVRVADTQHLLGDVFDGTFCE